MRHPRSGHDVASRHFFLALEISRRYPAAAVLGAEDLRFLGASASRGV